MAAQPIEKHQRVLESILASLERKILIAMARRMPKRVNSDHLTLLGVAAILLAGLFYFLSRWDTFFLHAVNLMIVVNWFGDSLDGTLARVRDQQRPRYGYYVDHILDSLGVFVLMTGLALSGFMTERVAAVFLISYLLLNIHIYLTTSVLGIFKISFGLFGPTELRIVLMVGNWVLLTRSEVTLLGHRFLLYDIGGLASAAVLLVILIISAARISRQLYRLETL